MMVGIQPYVPQPGGKIEGRPPLASIPSNAIKRPRAPPSRRLKPYPGRAGEQSHTIVYQTATAETSRSVHGHVASAEKRKQLLIEPPETTINYERRTEPQHRVIQRRYVWRLRFKTGDRVIVCVRKDGFSSWKHGFVANLHDMPPIATGGGQYAYPVVYQRNPRALDYFRSSQGTILYDAVLSTGADLDPYEAV